MIQTYFFQYNLPVENHINKKPDHFINVISELHINGEFSHVYVNPILGKHDLFVILNGAKVVYEMEAIAEQHFANFPPSNAVDITDTRQGKELIALMHNLINGFGRNVRS